MEKIRCRFCKGKAVKRGFRHNSSGRKQLYLCKNCRRKFTTGDFLRRRFRKDDIMLAISLYRKGLSSAEVREKLRKSGVCVSRWTIIKWSRTFK
jgi:transposase-like protein